MERRSVGTQGQEQSYLEDRITCTGGNIWASPPFGIGGGVLKSSGIIATVFSVILTAVLVVVSGVLAVVSGIALLIAEPAVGLALIGGGLIAGVCGVIASVLLVKLCMIAFPAAGRWIAKGWNKVKNRKKVA